MPHDIRIVTEQELRSCVKLNLETIAVVERAFEALATGKVIMPPILSMNIPDANAEVDVKTAFIPGFDGFAIKVSPGFFNNPQLGIPSLNGLMILFSAKTGLVEAVFLDNGYLTDIRTAAAGAVAAKHIAPENIEVAGVLGTGVQARLQMEAAYLMRRFKKVLVWGRDMQKAKACASDLATSLNVETAVTDDAQSLIQQSQLVVTTTPAKKPIVQSEWLHPGLHITAVGSDQEGKNEIEPHALVEAGTYICDRVSQCEKLGELRSAIEAGLWRNETPAELGEIITRTKPGRLTAEDITICDLTGTGAQDTAIATHALRAADGFGSVIKV